MAKTITAVTFAITIGTVALISFLLSLPTYLLWNGCLVGAIDGVKEVTWLQAWGIQFLFAMLFKNSAFEVKK